MLQKKTEQEKNLKKSLIEWEKNFTILHII